MRLVVQGRVSREPTTRRQHGSSHPGRARGHRERAEGRKGFKEIARLVGHSHTTVKREVVKHAQESEKGAKGRVTNRCVKHSSCQHRHLCLPCAPGHGVPLRVLSGEVRLTPELVKP